MLLHLVRHAPSQQDPARPADEWGLADGAAAAVAQLQRSGALPEQATWYSSPEPKAVMTAALLGAEPAIDPRLKEQQRAAVWFDDESAFTACVHLAFAEPDRPAISGWEPLGVTRGRVTAAVREILARSDGAVVAVGHGTAWTLLVAELTGARPDLAAWVSMTMPDHCVLDPGTGTVVSDWGGWRR